MWVSIPSNPYNYLHNNRLNNHAARIAWVTWRPPETHLHYPELYAGVYEYLREAPVSGREVEARAYLQALNLNLNAYQTLPYDFGGLQRDRIAWVRAWLRQLAASEPRRQQIG